MPPVPARSVAPKASAAAPAAAEPHAMTKSSSNPSLPKPRTTASNTKQPRPAALATSSSAVRPLIKSPSASQSLTSPTKTKVKLNPLPASASKTGKPPMSSSPAPKTLKPSVSQPALVLPSASSKAGLPKLSAQPQSKVNSLMAHTGNSEGTQQEAHKEKSQPRPAQLLSHSIGVSPSITASPTPLLPSHDSSVGSSPVPAAALLPMPLPVHSHRSLAHSPPSPISFAVTPQTPSPLQTPTPDPASPLPRAISPLPPQAAATATTAPADVAVSSASAGSVDSSLSINIVPISPEGAASHLLAAASVSGSASSTPSANSPLPNARPLISSQSAGLPARTGRSNSVVSPSSNGSSLSPGDGDSESPRSRTLTTGDSSFKIEESLSAHYPQHQLKKRKTKVKIKPNTRFTINVAGGGSETFKALGHTEAHSASPASEASPSPQEPVDDRVERRRTLALVGSRRVLGESAGPVAADVPVGLGSFQDSVNSFESLLAKHAAQKVAEAKARATREVVEKMRATASLDPAAAHSAEQAREALMRRSSDPLNSLSPASLAVPRTPLSPEPFSPNEPVSPYPSMDSHIRYEDIETETDNEADLSMDSTHSMSFSMDRRPHSLAAHGSIAGLEAIQENKKAGEVKEEVNKSQETPASAPVPATAAAPASEPSVPASAPPSVTVPSPGAVSPVSADSPDVPMLYGTNSPLLVDGSSTPTCTSPQSASSTRSSKTHAHAINGIAQAASETPPAEDAASASKAKRRSLKPHQRTLSSSYATIAAVYRNAPGVAAAAARTSGSNTPQKRTTSTSSHFRPSQLPGNPPITGNVGLPPKPRGLKTGGNDSPILPVSTLVRGFSHLYSQSASQSVAANSPASSSSHTSSSTAQSPLASGSPMFSPTEGDAPSGTPILTYSASQPLCARSSTGGSISSNTGTIINVSTNTGSGTPPATHQGAPASPASSGALPGPVDSQGKQLTVNVNAATAATFKRTEHRADLYHYPAITGKIEKTPSNADQANRGPNSQPAADRSAHFMSSSIHTAPHASTLISSFFNCASPVGPANAQGQMQPLPGLQLGGSPAQDEVAPSSGGAGNPSGLADLAISPYFSPLADGPGSPKNFVSLADDEFGGGDYYPIGYRMNFDDEDDTYT